MRAALSIFLGLLAALSALGGVGGCLTHADELTESVAFAYGVGGLAGAVIFGALAVLVSDVEELRNRREPPPPGVIR